MTFTVNSTADLVDATPGDGVCETAPGSGVCTLRAAIQEGNALPGADTITVPAGTYLLTIAGAGEDLAATGDLDITGDLTITGAGVGQTVIDGGGLDRVFDIIGSSPAVEIADLTIRNGRPPLSSGGGVRNAGTLSLTNVMVMGNRASGGGGIANLGTLSLEGVTVSGNRAAGGGGGISHDLGNATLSNVTVSGNRAAGGGGIANLTQFFPPSGTMTLTNVTVSGNTALLSSGGGITSAGTMTLTNLTFAGNAAPAPGLDIANLIGATITLKNTIVASSPSGTNCGGPVTSAGHNLDRGTSCNLAGPGDLSSTDPQFGALAPNGGATQTHALLTGSPAIDAGDDNGCPTTDQRGVARPQGAACDIGAWESVPGEALLAVTRTGTGGGTVASDLAGIDCGADCSQPYASGTPITLTVTPGPNSAFTGWSGGGCTGTDPCTLTIAADTFVTATFTKTGTTLAVPGDHPTIQAAIDAADDGDTILVAPGTYVENVSFLGRAITVTSEGGPAVTTIDGDQADTVVSFASGDTSVLMGFTVRNGDPTAPLFGVLEGGGIRIGSSSPTVVGNVITENRACSGAGIAILSASPLVQENVVSNNTAICVGGTGSGIFIGGFGAAHVVGNTIANNTGSSSGGGIGLNAAGTPTIRANVITGNIAAAEGGGISLGNVSDALIAGNLIVKNQAGRGGGLLWLVPGAGRGPRLINNTIADNDGAQGSGIFADGFDTQTELTNNIVVAKVGQTAVFCGDFGDTNPPVFRFNDVFAPSGTAYGGICTDQTGLNGNISADPVFANPSLGNYHLQGGSPAIDAGDGDTPDLPAIDLDGDPRILGSAVDIGADEFNPTNPNAAPTFIKGPDQTVLEDSGPQTVVGWATAISAGPPDEAGQTLAFLVVGNTNPALFAVPPVVSATGTLTYAPAPNASGTATITVRLQDDGGTANGGVDTSGPQTFTITIVAVNEAPTFTRGPDQTVLEDSGPQTAVGWATAISAGPPDEAGQTLGFLVVGNTNPALFAVPPVVAATGTLTYAPAPNANGSATVTVRLQDDGGTANGGVDTSPPQSFTITVMPVNDAPSFTKGLDQTVAENAGPQTVDNWATALSTGPPDEAGQTLTFLVVGNTNPALFMGAPAVSSTGTLTYTPAPNASGMTTVTVRLRDSGGIADGGVDTSPPQAFTITVTPVNHPPTISDIPGQATDENTPVGPIAFTVGDAETPAAGLTVSGTSSNPTLVPNANIVFGGSGASRTVTLTPALDQAGTATITVTVSDGSLTASDTFLLTVTPITGAFFTLTPCRVADTRNPPGPSGGPALAANTTRTFPAAGLCGIPVDATAIAINVTVVEETDVGDLRVFPAGSPVPAASTINFVAGHVRANNAIIPLGTGGQISVHCDMLPGSTGTTHFLFDVTGYFK